MNNIQLIGNLCKEWNTHNGSTTVSKNTLAVKRKFKKDESDFITVTAFGKGAELLEQYTSKGSKIGIVGRLQSGSYEKEGKTVYTTEVIIDEFEFLDSKKSNDSESGGNQTPSSTKAGFSDDIDDDSEFPF